MKDRNITWNELVRYMGGELLPEERESIEGWVKANPEHKKFISYIRTIWESPAEEKQDWDGDAAWHRFQKEYGNEMFLDEESLLRSVKEENDKPQNKSVHSGGNLHIPSLMRWGAVAAAVGAIVLIVLFNYQPASEVQRKHPMKEIVTKNGQRTYLRLSDGSQVVLNAGSHIKIPETFSGNERLVELSGEAYFDVTHHPERPFVVYTQRATTRVLGTKFDVKAYPGNTSVQVVVKKGKVSLQPRSTNGSSGSGTGSMITKLQRGVLDKRKVTVSAVKDVAPYIGWTEGKLIFDNDSMAKVAADLQRWYNIPVKIKEPGLKKVQFTGSFTTRQPLDEVLDAIALSLDIHYSKNDMTIIFYN